MTKFNYSKAVWIVLLAPSWAIAAASPAAIGASNPSSPPSLKDRIQDIYQRDIQKDSPVRVIYEDTLGDGAGTWDPRPRSRVRPGGSQGDTRAVEKTNCLNWLLEVLSLAYSGERGFSPQGAAEKLLDQLRYFGTHPAWGARKHFVDQMLWQDPGPWQPIPREALPASCRILLKKGRARLDIGGFAKRNAYPCALPAWNPGSGTNSGSDRIDFEYIGWSNTKKHERCLKDLAEGVYGIFGVSTAHHNRFYGKKSGNQGRTHGAFLIVDKPAGERDPWLDMRVLHASVRNEKPLSESMGGFSLDRRNWFSGYQLLRLPETWSPDPEKQKSMSHKLETTVACEKAWVASPTNPVRTRLELK